MCLALRNMDEIRQELAKTLKLKFTEDTSALLPETFKFDKICPFFLNFHSSVRALVAQCPLVLHDKLIVQVDEQKNIAEPINFCAFLSFFRIDRFA